MVGALAFPADLGGLGSPWLLPPQVLRVGVVDAEAGLLDGFVPDGTRVPQQRSAPGGPDAQPGYGLAADLDAGAAELLEVVGQLVDRARHAGELRGDVTVADVLLVIATAAPTLPDAAQQAAASSRLLDILLEGLRSRPA